MTSADKYISRVIDQLPATPMRGQIAMELRGLIAERVERGQSVDDVVRQLGDPVELAESYLSAVPLVSASFWHRAAAKAVDVGAILIAVGSTMWLLMILGAIPQEISITLGVLLVVLLLVAYTVAAEYRTGCTLGKWLLGLRVVRESGARIGIVQSIVRQLPVLGQIYLIDVLFALFTEKSQRAFELASKTRVVTVEREERPKEMR